jgi:predicted RNA-binding protein associated with RNAse of E/G family
MLDMSTGTPSPRWSRGDHVVLREIWNGRVWSAWPSVVVEDRPDQLIVYVPAGATVKHAARADGRELRLYEDRWTFADRVTSRPLLSFTWPGTEHATMASWDAQWRFTGWYINLERPLGRSGVAYDFLDHCLDILVPPDRSTWTWKDVDELDEAVRRGIFTEQDAARFYAEGRRAARRLMAGEPPFDRDWSSWRPDPAWPVPTLPDPECPGYDARHDGRLRPPA